MPGRVLITGSSGFTAPYLRAALEERAFEVTGVADRSKGQTDHPLDLTDADAVERFFATQSFDYVVHLAAVSFVAHERASDYYRVNVLGSANLLDALARQQPRLKKLIVASSANVYGRPGQIPVDESASAAPLSHYGVSKFAMELMARQWFDRLPILITRPFNYSGVGQSAKFVYPKIIGHFRSREKAIELGDTTVIREFMDVRDVAAVYAELLNCAADSDVVNLCSGIGYRLGEVLDRLRQLTGEDPRIRRAEALVRGNEIPELVGSPAKLRRIIGPIAFRPLDETIRWMLAA